MGNTPQSSNPLVGTPVDGIFRDEPNAGYVPATHFSRQASESEERYESWEASRQQEETYQEPDQMQHTTSRSGSSKFRTRKSSCQRMPLTEERKRKARIGAAKVFYIMEMEEKINVETQSVYGSAIVMPQLARSAGWPAQMMVLAGRSVLFLILNVCLQWALVFSLLKEQLVMDKFSGQMYLCDFGAQKVGCPEADGCLGPGGSRITPSRMYDFQTWRIQKFVKESFKTIFPEKLHDIEDKIDPGEYGVESAYCRHICAFLFVMAVTTDFFECANLVRLMWVIPNADDTWMDLDEEEGENFLDEVNVQIRGMPLHWKLVNLILIVCPKYFLWQFTASSGVTFLLETSTICDTIVNSTALAFILGLDEMVFVTMSADATKFLMGKLEGFPVHYSDINHPNNMDPENAPRKARTSRISEEDMAIEKVMTAFMSMSDESILTRSRINNWCTSRSILIKAPMVVVIWLFFESRYFLSMCTRGQDGAWVSVPVYRPDSTDFNIWSAFFPWAFPPATSDSPFWSMPREVPSL